MSLVSVVIPVYDEEQNVMLMHDRLDKLAEQLPPDEVEFIFVDDGSRDKTFALLSELAARDPRIKVLSLSRNFGSHSALRAGYGAAGGNCVASIAGDLQDPPELIAQMVEKWHAGAEIVWAVRAGRDESAGYQWFASLYYWLMRTFALKDYPPGGMDLVLMDRQVVDELLIMAEKNTTLFGQILWMGFKQVFIPYRREARRFGTTKWSFDRKVKMVLDSLTSFSSLPIRIWYYFGAIVAGIGLIGLLGSLVALFAQSGWALFGMAFFLLVVLLGLSFVATGIVGEYVWRTFDQARPRPSYIIREKIGF